MIQFDRKAMDTEAGGSRWGKLLLSGFKTVVFFYQLIKNAVPKKFRSYG